MERNDVIQIITGITLKYLSEKVNEYGTNHFFAVLDEGLKKKLIELGDMKNLFGNTMVNAWKLMR